MPTILKMMALAAATYCNGSCKNECSIICPVCHRLCREVTPEDWLKAYSDSKYDYGRVEVPPFKRDQQVFQIPEKCKYCGSDHMDLLFSHEFICARCKDCGKTLSEWHKEESSTERPKFKCVICKLVDKDDHEICCGGCFAHNEHARDDTPFEEFEKEANKSLLGNFREAMAAKLPSCANKTQEELKGIIEAMIALEGYKIGWFSCGWEDNQCQLK